jgi:hypothetical protein
VVFFERFKETFNSLFQQQESLSDEDADPLVESTWCIFVDTLGRIGVRQPFFMHFDCPGEAREWADSMVGSGFAISEPFFCDCPTRARNCFAASGEHWRHTAPQQ